MIHPLRNSRRLIVTLSRLSKLRVFASSQRNFKVSVLGASGGIGQPLGLLLKMNNRITKLALYDIAKVTPGVAKDISHINTCCNCEGFAGEECLGECLDGSHVVVVPAGLPRKPGMTRDDLFKKNAGIVLKLTCAVAKYCPCAVMCIITNPVNSMLPIASEVMMMNGVYDGAKLFGVTTLDLVRASTFVGEITGGNPACQYVPVVGGHAGATIVPLLSQCKPPLSISDDDRDALTKRIQEAGTEVVKAKAGGGSATLSMAFAAARFTDSVLRGLAGDSNVLECAYVASCTTKATYFATPIILGCSGLEVNLGLGQINCYEQVLIEKAVPILEKNISTGVDFVRKSIKRKK